MYSNPPYYISAYGLAVKHGFRGTEEQWLESLTAYGLACATGFEGTLEEWLDSIRGTALAVTIEEIPGGHRVTITDGKNPKVFDVMNGNGNVSSVAGVLPDGEGNVALSAKDVHALGENDTAAAAKKLETTRKIFVDLESEAEGDFNGQNDIDVGVKGALPVKHGGHGATDAAGARKNLGAQKQRVSVAVILPATGWADNQQTVAVAGVTADNDIDVSPAPTNFAAYCEAGVYCSAQSADSLSFTCEDVPDKDLTVHIRIWE